MKKLNKAFTIAEVLVIFSIIGIILVLQLQIVQHKINQYNATYFSVYNALKRISYNILADNDCPDCTFGSEEVVDPVDPTKTIIQCRRTGELSKCPLEGTRPFPQNAHQMCERIVEFFNLTTEEDSICPGDADESAIAFDNDDEIDEINSKFIDEGDNRTLQFATTNAHKFYISKRMNKNFGIDNINYFIIYIDLNGNKRPNAYAYRERDNEILPDIVPFILTERGEVLPIGFPIYSTKYLSARIQYPAIADANGNPTQDYSPSMSFYEATQAAWQEGRDNPDITFTWNMINDVPINARTVRLKEKNNRGETNYVTFPVLNRNNSYTNIVRNRINTSKNKGCVADSFNCRVSVDSNMNTRF